MTIPQWTLLGFAAWTLGLLVAAVGVYRWGNILFAKARIAAFRSDALDGGRKIPGEQQERQQRTGGTHGRISEGALTNGRA